MKTYDSLSSGKCLVRKIWKNPNKPGQISVQFIQEIEVPMSASLNPLVAIAQGLGDVGKNRVTAILSFKEEVAIKLFGTLEADYSEGEAVDASVILGSAVGIQVTENFTANPYAANHEPKKNPKTDEYVMGKDEDGRVKPIYRHTEILPLEAINHSFVESVRREESAATGAKAALG